MMPPTLSTIIAQIRPSIATLGLPLAGLVSINVYVCLCVIHGGDIDYRYFNTISKYLFQYAASPFDLSAISPVAGLGGPLVPLGVWLNPVHTIPHLLCTWLDYELTTKVTAVTVAYIAIYVLARTLGLNRLLSTIASQIPAIIYFYPNKMANTPICLLAPSYMILITTSCLILTMVIHLGKSTRWSNITICLALPIVALYSILCHPLSAILPLIPTTISSLCLLTWSERRVVLRWRLVGLAYSIIFLGCLRIPSFYRHMKSYAARYQLPNELATEVQSWDYLTPYMFQSTTSSLIMIAVLLSGAWIAVNGTREQNAFSISVLIYLNLTSIMAFIYVYSGIRWQIPLPDYFDFTAHVSYILIALLGIQYLSQRLSQFVRVWLVPSTNLKTFITGDAVRGIVAYGCVFVIPFLGTLNAVNKMNWGIADLKSNFFRLFPSEQRLNAEIALPKTKSISNFLQDKLGISLSNSVFRGSIATVVGVPGGPVATRLGFSSSAPWQKANTDLVPLYLRRTFDSNLDLVGLWGLGIPTLENYSQLVSPPLHYVFSRALSRPIDYHGRNWNIVTLVRPHLIEALGGKCILTDQHLRDRDVSLEARVVNREGIAINIYATRHPNLANYSPTNIHLVKRAVDSVSMMTRTDFSFRDEVVVHSREHLNPLTELVPADRGEMRFVKGGLRIQARSTGRSLLLLPIEFSNCLKIVERYPNHDGNVLGLIRSNLILTGMIFEGEVDVRLAHIFGPLRDVKCRQLDIEEVRSLEIREDGAIPYPPNFQPLARPNWFIWKPVKTFLDWKAQ